MTTSTTYPLLRALRRAGVSVPDIRDGWLQVIRALDDPAAAQTLADRYPEDWPLCACAICTDPATTIEPEVGELSCVGCTDYAVDDDGDVHCAHCDDDVEVVTESCGAGQQTRTYCRVTARR